MQPRPDPGRNRNKRRLRPVSPHFFIAPAVSRRARRRRMLGVRASKRLSQRERLDAQRMTRRMTRFGMPALLLGLLCLSFAQEGPVLAFLLVASTLLLLALYRLEKNLRK